MPLPDNEYNKIKMLYKLSNIASFIKIHAMRDARDTQDQKLITFLTESEKQLDAMITNLYSLLCNSEKR